MNFENIRKNIICNKNYVYADWTASGRIYKKIEEHINCNLGPSFGNTHTASNDFGVFTSFVYHDAKDLIKHYCGAKKDDHVLITGGQGMTTMIRKFQRLIGLTNNTVKRKKFRIFITHAEHHSNQISWTETDTPECVKLFVIPHNPEQDCFVNVESLKAQIEMCKKEEAFDENVIIIGAFTACSNVTGVETCYQELANVIHEYGGFCIVDFACSAPYVKIDMKNLDAICFSGHKFLGGPGTCGVLILKKSLYHTEKVPDNPGGGTVNWTNPWGGRKYIEDPETREDGGTPSLIQTIKLALCFVLKEEVIGVERIKAREREIIDLFYSRVGPGTDSGIEILDFKFKESRILPVFAILFEKNIHYNLAVSILSDRFKILARGGCSCAGTYGHYLLGIDTPEKSKSITDRVDDGLFDERPGWLRISLHFTATNEEVEYVCRCLKLIAENGVKWSAEYVQNPYTGEFTKRVVDNCQIIKARQFFKGFGGD